MYERTAQHSAQIQLRAEQDTAPREPLMFQHYTYEIGEHGWAVVFYYTEDSKTEPGKQHVTKRTFDGQHWS